MDRLYEMGLRQGKRESKEEIEQLEIALDYEKNTKLEWLLSSGEADEIIKRAGYVKESKEMERLRDLLERALPRLQGVSDEFRRLIKQALKGE